MFDYEQVGGDCKGNITVVNGIIDPERKYIVDYDIDVLDTLIDDYNMLSLNEGEKIESIGRGMVDVVCTSVQQEDGVIIKTFNIRFQCDESPVFVIKIDNEGDIVSCEYSDDDGNESIEDNGYYNEMVADLQ